MKIIGYAKSDVYHLRVGEYLSLCNVWWEKAPIMTLEDALLRRCCQRCASRLVTLALPEILALVPLGKIFPEPIGDP